ncbi:hypothetical protein [Fontivita pretiosa]|uniref:hypothetical protein n=1 Tax=Fontivita pretiosa TaxID=2989684 RepID=UPI003D16450C
MAVDLICPDCGGIIGGDTNDPDGRGPCTCHLDLNAGFSKDPSADTVSLPSPPREQGAQRSSGSSGAADVRGGNDLAGAPQKICVICGKNVAGHRRLKDSRGYLCLDCAKAEKRQEREGKVPCAECGRYVKPGGIVEYNGLRICRKCHEDHKQLQKKAVKKVATKHYEEHEKRNLLILLAIFVALGLIVLWRQLS